MAVTGTAKDIHNLMKNIASFSDGQATVEDCGSGDAMLTVRIVPNDGLYRGGTFDFQVNFSSYPEKAPLVTCLTKIYHPNIEESDDSGSNICLNLLDSDQWTSNYTLEDVVQGILFLLYNPELEDPLSSWFDGDTDREEFSDKVARSLRGETVDEIEFEKNFELEPYLSIEGIVAAVMEDILTSVTDITLGEPTEDIVSAVMEDILTSVTDSSLGEPTEDIVSAVMEDILTSVTNSTLGEPTEDIVSAVMEDVLTSGTDITLGEPTEDIVSAVMEDILTSVTDITLGEPTEDIVSAVMEDILTSGTDITLGEPTEKSSDVSEIIPLNSARIDKTVLPEQMDVVSEKTTVSNTTLTETSDLSTFNGVENTSEDAPSTSPIEPNCVHLGDGASVHHDPNLPEKNSSLFHSRRHVTILYSDNLAPEITFLSVFFPKVIKYIFRSLFLRSKKSNRFS